MTSFLYFNAFHFTYNIDLTKLLHSSLSWPYNTYITVIATWWVTARIAYLIDFTYLYIQFLILHTYHALQLFYDVSQSDRFNFKSLNECEVFVDIRSHCFVETWEQYRGQRSRNLDSWKKCLSKVKRISWYSYRSYSHN